MSRKNFYINDANATLMPNNCYRQFRAVNNNIDEYRVVDGILNTRPTRSIANSPTQSLLSSRRDIRKQQEISRKEISSPVASRSLSNRSDTRKHDSNSIRANRRSSVRQLTSPRIFEGQPARPGLEFYRLANNSARVET